MQCKKKIYPVSNKHIHCKIVKTSTFFLWVLVYMLIMRLTIFKSNKVEDNDNEDMYLSNETELWQVNHTNHYT